MKFKMKLKKGDTVVVTSGKYKGKTGKISQVFPNLNKVSVEGLNIVKKNIKPSRYNPKGGVQEITKPLWASKVAIYDSVKKKPSRIGYKVSKTGAKTRILVSSGKEIK